MNFYYLILILQVIKQCVCFQNIYERPITITLKDELNDFGYSVALSKKTVYVGSAKSSQNGVVYKCEDNEQCKVYLDEEKIWKGNYS